MLLCACVCVHVCVCVVRVCERKLGFVRVMVSMCVVNVY